MKTKGYYESIIESNLTNKDYGDRYDIEICQVDMGPGGVATASVDCIYISDDSFMAAEYSPGGGRMSPSIVSADELAEICIEIERSWSRSMP